VLHETVRAGNAALDSEDLQAAASARSEVVAMTEILGINPLSPAWATNEDTAARAALDTLVSRLIDDRATARDNKDYAAADRIRAELTAAGITLEDTQTGAHWSLES